MCGQNKISSKKNYLMLQKIDTCIVKALKTIQKQIIDGDATVAIDFLKVSSQLKKQYEDITPAAKDLLKKQYEDITPAAKDLFKKGDVDTTSLPNPDLNGVLYAKLSGVLKGKK